MPEVPFVTVSYDEKKRETIATNLPPEARPTILWLLMRATQMVLTQVSEQEKSKIVPENGRAEFLKRMTG
mgnify:CR=1 FL=1